MSTLDLVIVVTAIAVCSGAVYAGIIRRIRRVVDTMQTALAGMMHAQEEESAKARAEEERRWSMRRMPLPFSSNGPVETQRKVTLSRKLAAPFKPQRVFISGLGPNGSSDWVVEDIRVDGRSQFNQLGSVPGDMFSHQSTDGFVTFDTANDTIQMDVRFIGNNGRGMPFYGGMIGEVAPEDFDKALASLSAS